MQKQFSVPDEEKKKEQKEQKSKSVGKPMIELRKATELLGR